MKPEKLIEVLSVAERLKDAVRHSYTSGGRRESVAEHSWRITLMAYFVSDEFPEADLLKIMKMCLIHDLGEAFTGDIPAFENDLTFVGSLETAQNTEGCSLSAATGSQQCQELIFADIQIEIIQNHLIVK